MNNSLPSISELRNNLNFASISQFFHTFSSAFRPWPIQHYNQEQEQEEYVFETEVIKKNIFYANYIYAHSECRTLKG